MTLKTTAAGRTMTRKGSRPFSLYDALDDIDTLLDLLRKCDEDLANARSFINAGDAVSVAMRDAINTRRLQIAAALDGQGR